MSQQLSPWLEGAYGWSFGEGGWNSGMDANLLKFSFMFDRNVDSIVASLPSAINGQAHYLTTDNRLYFAVGTTYFSTVVPKWFTVVVRSTGAAWQFNGSNLVGVESATALDARLDAVELTIASLGTAAFEDISAFATAAELDIVEANAQAYTDDLRQDLVNNTDPAKGAELVGFNGGTVRDKLLTIVSVEDFGAVGNGIADDTAAIQAALDASVRVLFSPGSHYLVSAKLNLSSNHIVQIQGATLEQLTDQTPIFDATSLSNITIEGGHFVGKVEATYTNTPSSQAIAIKAPSVNGISVRNNRFEGFYYSALMVGLAGNNIDFSRNVVVGPGAAVLGADINFRNTTGATILGTNVRIDGNDISATATGLIIGQGSASISVTGNVIHGMINEHGIYADTGMKTLSISGNTIRSTGVAGVGIKVQHYDSFGVAPENISIVGNSVSFCGSDGILIINTDGSGASLFATGVSITGNSVYSCAQHGIDIRNARGCSVSGNSIEQTAESGLYVSRCSALSVNGNTVREASAHGIFDDGTSSDVSYLSNNLTLIGSDPINHMGILIQGVSEHTISNNVVRSTAARMLYGMFITAAPGGLSTTEIRGNSFTGAAQLGLRLPAAAGQLRYIGQNKISGVAGNNIGQSIPETQQLGAEEDTHYGTAAPTSGTWRQGAKVFTRYPAAGGFIGWTCVVGGTPGTWKTFGPVTA